ncbi:related to centromere binding factor 1 [Sporisorium scitamineum]|uniref:Related to centromere binding factor 1 n=1 Tax=Sporisorium scitamineum TaxID=49012 RepID=A0A127ZHH0_9BASI|nr:related to centromere binding factor 1 [Sporisorium scitamineum]
MSAATESAATAEHLVHDRVAATHDTDASQEAGANNDAGSAASAAAAAAAVIDNATNPSERDHIERDVSNILAGLNQEQIASIVAAARASEARNADGTVSGDGEGFNQSTPYGLGQAASALTSIASGFKRTPGNDRTNLGTTTTTDAEPKDHGYAPPPPGVEYQDDKELDADTSAAIAAVKSATDTATAAAIASLGSLASQSTHQDTPDADESIDYDSPNGDSSPSRALKRPRGLELDRQRKDNHKEVERRRRSAINDGITQLSHIVPGCDAKNTNKGAIIHAAVRYIQDLKHNEASNIEKWTLEKLLMDQAMGDLTAQLDEAQQQIERLRHELDERYAQEDGQGKT